MIEEKMGNNLELIGTSKYFLNIVPLAQEIKSIINRWDLNKLRPNLDVPQQKKG